MNKKLYIYVFFGLIASGKSTLARAWADRHGLFCYNSDVVRKDLAGATAAHSRQDSFDQGIYSKEFSRKTYSALLEKAKGDLTRGDSVVLDASYQSRKERQRVRELAARYKAQVLFILCACPEQEMKRRMEERARDPQAISDGRWEIYLQQQDTFEAPDECEPSEIFQISTMAPTQTLIDQMEQAISEKI